MCDKNVKQIADNNSKTSVRGVIQGLPSREETLGDIVITLLRAGQIISRRTLCLKLIGRIEAENNPAMQAHLNDLLRLILRKNPL